MTDHDDDLRTLFADARRAESSRAPAFERVVAGRPTGRRRRGSLILGFGIAVVVVAAGVAIRIGIHPSRVAPVDFPIGRLEMPTDFLLKTLGSETLRSVPAIGTDDWFPRSKGGTS